MPVKPIREWNQAPSLERLSLGCSGDKFPALTVKNEACFLRTDVVVHGMSAFYVFAHAPCLFPLNHLLGDLICRYLGISLLVNVVMNHSVIQLVWVKRVAHHGYNIVIKTF